MCIGILAPALDSPRPRVSQADLTDPASARRILEAEGYHTDRHGVQIVSLSALEDVPGLEPFEAALAGAVSGLPREACGLQHGEAAVVDASTSREGGPSLLCVVRRGSVGVGDSFVCGALYGRVKALWQCDATDRLPIHDATPGAPWVRCLSIFPPFVTRNAHGLSLCQA